MGLVEAADSRAPLYLHKLDTSRPEEQLVEAFELAKKALFRFLPDDVSLDERQALLASDVVGQQVLSKQGSITPALESNLDLAPSSSLTLDSAQSRQYYLGKYVAACQGIGSYPSGLGRDAVAQGLMTQDEYLKGIEVRLRAFSEIIHAGETGQLENLLHGEKFGSDQLVSTGGTSLSGKLALSGYRPLGDPLTVGAIVLISIIAVAIVGGITYYYVRREEINRTTNMMRDLCTGAVSKGNDKAVSMCQDFAEAATSRGIGENILGKQGQRDLVKYIALGGALYLGVMLLPSITESLREAQYASRSRR